MLHYLICDSQKAPPGRMRCDAATTSCFYTKKECSLTDGECKFEVTWFPVIWPNDCREPDESPADHGEVSEEKTHDRTRSTVAIIYIYIFIEPQSNGLRAKKFFFFVVVF